MNSLSTLFEGLNETKNTIIDRNKIISIKINQNESILPALIKKSMKRASIILATNAGLRIESQPNPIQQSPNN